MTGDPAAEGLAGGMGRNFAVLVAQLGCRAGSMLFLAATLGPTGQGEVALAQVVALVGMTIVAVGLDNALTRSTAIERLRGEAHAVLWLHAAAVAALALVAAGVLRLAAPGLDAVQAGVVAAGALLFPRLAAACALGEGRERAYAWLSIAPYAAFVVAIVALEAAGELSSGSALAALAITSVGVAAISVPAVAGWARAAPRRALRAFETYRMAVHLWPGHLAQLGNYRLDQLLIAALLPRADLGLYSLAVASSEAAALPGQAAANLIFPRASTTAEIRRATVRAAAVTGGIVLLAVVPYFVLVEVLLPDYDDSLLPFVVLVPGAAAVAVSKVLAAFVAARGGAAATSRIAITVLAVTIVADLALIPPFELVGAAVASSVAYFCSAALMYRAFRAYAGAP